MMRRDGFVLVAALWLIVALSAVGLDAALRSQARRQPALYQLDAVRAREAALAGSEYARSRLTAALRQRAEELRDEAAVARNERLTRRAINLGMGEDLWRDPAGLIPPEMSLGDAEFQLDVRDAGMLLNLNEASADMLFNFMSLGLRFDYAVADRITQSIMDWRDADELPRINGAERAEYMEEGAAVLPPDRAFIAIDELRHVMHVTPELYEQMAPYLTVTGSGRININAAPEPVLLAVPSFSPNVAREVARRRNAGFYPRNASELRALLGRIYIAPTGQEASEFNRRVTFQTNEVEVVSHGRISGSPVHATVRTILGRTTTEAMVLWWRVE